MLRSLLVFFAAGVFLSAPMIASAQVGDFFGPVVPEECNCRDLTLPDGTPYVSAPDFGCVLQTVQNAVNLGVSIILVFITLVLAYSGIMFIVNPTNAEHRSKAKSMVMNAVIGLVIVLTAWLIVDFLMKAFYNEDAAGEALTGRAEALPWNKILGDGTSSRPMCFAPTSVTPTGGGGGTATSTPGTSGTPSTPSSPSATSSIPTAPNNGSATTIPQTPEYFSAAASSASGEIQLAWAPQNNVDRYQLDRAIETRLNSGVPGVYKFVSYVEGDEIDYVDSNLASGMLYYYRLFATNEAGTTPISAKTQAVTRTTTSTPSGSSGTEPTISVNSGVVISSNALTVLKSIVKTAGLSSATVTSGRRTTADQARVMYDNLETHGASHQKDLYSTYGDQVIDVYVSEKAAGKSATAIKSAMQAKIVALGPSNVSKHCSDSHDVFDVAPSSIADATKFKAALQSALSSGKITKYISPPTDPSYHIEIAL